MKLIQFDSLNHQLHNTKEGNNCFSSKHDWFGSLPYSFNAETLDTIQQIYSKKNQYIRSAIHTVEGMTATIYVGSLLGITKKMDYVPLSTISTIISQCSALIVWSLLRKQYDDPTHIFNLLVKHELIGFKKEENLYRRRIPLQKEITASIDVTHVYNYHKGFVVKGEITLEDYMNTDLLGFVYNNN